MSESSRVPEIARNPLPLPRVGEERTVHGTVRTVETLVPEGHYRITVDVDMNADYNAESWNALNFRLRERLAEIEARPRCATCRRTSECDPHSISCHVITPEPTTTDQP